MAGFQGRFENVLLDVAEKVDSNKYLTAVKNSFTIFMPFVIIGSFGTLLNALVSSKTTGLAQWIPVLEKLRPAFTAMNFATMSCMTLPIVFLIAMQLARANKVPEYITGVVALASYISVVPNVVTISVDAVTKTVNTLPAETLGAQGLFIGMIMAVAVTEIFSKLTKIDRLKIKMPASVPQGIATSFNTLIPIFITLIISAVFGIIFRLLTGSYVNEFIYTIVQAPLEAIFQSPVGIVVVVIISQMFWFLGIHGGLVLSPIRNPLLASAIAANIAAMEAGMVPGQPVTYGFWMNYMVVGGAGIILSLIFALFLFSRREDHRMIAKLGLLPALCGISEPVVFGLPLVLNPTFMIPFIFNSGIATAIAMFATGIGFMPCNTVDTPFGVPILIGAFICHGWRGVVVQVIILVACTLTWAPFVLMANKQAKAS